jgi:hypothetical protein
MDFDGRPKVLWQRQMAFFISPHRAKSLDSFPSDL